MIYIMLSSIIKLRYRTLIVLSTFIRSRSSNYCIIIRAFIVHTNNARCECNMCIWFGLRFWICANIKHTLLCRSSVALCVCRTFVVILQCRALLVNALPEVPIIYNALPTQCACLQHISAKNKLFQPFNITILSLVIYDVQKQFLIHCIIWRM